MLGAIIGDIVGSRFEFNNVKTKDFDLLNDQCFFTDDTVMTLAIAHAFSFCMQLGTVSRKAALDHYLRSSVIDFMRAFGNMYPYAGYGGRFARWLREENPQPYNSFGNGAAMRVSACGFAATSLEEALSLAEEVTAVTHNHPEAIRGAKATTAAFFLARCGCSKGYIRYHIEKHYYTLDFTLDEIRDSYSYDVTCQGTVPQALVAFFESTDFEDAIRNAISIGGDSDMLAAITGGIAEAYYGVPYPLQKKIVKYLPEDLLGVLREFQSFFQKNNSNDWLQKEYGKYENTNRDGNDFLITGRYKIIPDLDLDDYDLRVYCESLWEPDEPIEFTPYFKYSLEEVLFRFLHSWTVIKADEYPYRCVGMIGFEKITEDESLVCFEMTVHPEEDWEVVFPSIIKSVFEQHKNTKKIIAPRNNIPKTVKKIYEQIGMTPDAETYLYQTVEWGEIPMSVYSFHRSDFVNV